MRVRLSDAEMRIALAIGGERHLESIRQGRRDNHGKTSGGGWTEHIEGAAGEIAAAKCLKMFWNGSVNSFKGADIGSAIQVRTRSRENYDLIVRNDDDDHHIFVLVLGQSPNFEIAGFIFGADAKKAQWQQSYGGRPEAYFVPRSALEPIGDQPAKRMFVHEFAR